MLLDTWKEKTLWMIFLIVAIPYVIFIIPQLLGLQAHIVSSGSMAPEMPEGSVIFSYQSDPADLQEGDIIVFETNSSNFDADLITHRIIEVEEGNYTTYYRTKGDANPSPDPGRVPAYNVIGKRAYSIPILGHLISLTQTTPFIIAILTIPAILLIHGQLSRVLGNSGKKDDSADQYKKKRVEKIPKKSPITHDEIEERDWQDIIED